MLSAVRKDSVLSRACARRVFERRNALAAVVNGASTQKSRTAKRRPGGGGRVHWADGPEKARRPGPTSSRRAAWLNMMVTFSGLHAGVSNGGPRMQSAEGKTRR